MIPPERATNSAVLRGFGLRCVMDDSLAMRDSNPRKGPVRTRPAPGDRPSPADAEPSGPGAAGWPEAAVQFGRRSLSFRVEPELVRALALREGESLESFLMSPLAAARDRDEIASRLDSGAPLGPVGVAVLESSPSAVSGHSDPPLIGINRAVLEIGDRIVRSVLVRTLVAHQIRAFASGEEPVEGAARKDAGLFLLLLGGESGEALYASRIKADLSSIFRDDSLLLRIIYPFLDKLPFVEKHDPAESEHGRAFVDPAFFDMLPLGSRVSAVAGGVLAWYTVLSARMLRAAAPLFRRVSPYYEPAYAMLGASFRKGFLLKKGFMSRAARHMLRGNVPAAVEHFWSGWNPVLARITIRPVYRMLGGNRRPVTASVLTFVYTALVVHPLGIFLAVLCGFRLALAVDPGFRAGEIVGSWTNFAVLGCAVGAYAFFGLLSGAAKLLRKAGR